MKMNFLKRMAPCFSINEANIKILKEPNDFFQFIKSKSSSCTKRIVIASLYLGSGKKEKSLVDAIFNSINNNIKNKNFRVHLLFDATRGSRSVIDHEGNKSSSRLMCLPLLDNKQTLSRTKISFFHTPNLRWWLYKVLPEKLNEVIGLQHMKIYLFDDCLVISGANLSEDYFTNRQDRYFVFDNSPLLCDFYEELVDIVGSRSYSMTSMNSLESPKFGCDPLSGNFNEYIVEFRDAIESFIRCQIIKAQERESTDSGELTRVYPLIQMGLFGIMQDQIVLKKLFEALSWEKDKQMSVALTSGYFNLDDDNENLLFEIAKRNVSIEVLTAAPEANGFFKARGLMKYIPDVYTNILFDFQMRSLNLPIKTFEWRKKNWTFHAKGFWISKLISDYTQIYVTLIGSTNYGYRSCFRDLESEILIETQSEKLQKDLIDEKNRIYCNGLETQNQRVIPSWIPWVVPIVKYFF